MSAAPAKPTLLQINPANIPLELRAIPAWVGWRLALENDRWTKKPVNLMTGELAETDNPGTWCDFETALRDYKRHGCDGIGLCRTADLIFIDCDGVFDEDGDLLTFPWAKQIVAAIKGRAYMEKSISGTGLHSICRGTLPPGRRQFDDRTRAHTGFALYDRNRFFTFSGVVLPDCGDIRDLTTELGVLHRELFPAGSRPPKGGERPPATAGALGDRELLDRARRAKNGGKFSMLFAGDWSDYSSQSEADLALCFMLAFWTRRDTERMDGLFRQSGLMRDKWLRDDYRERTLATACESITEVWEPRRSRAPMSTEALNGPPMKGKPVNDQDISRDYEEDSGDSLDHVHGGTIKSPVVLGLPKTGIRGSPPRPSVGSGIGTENQIDLLSSAFATGDLGNAQRLIAMHGHDLRYNHDFGKWLTWDGHRWKIDTDEQARKLAQETMLEFVRQAMRSKDADLLTFAAKSLKSPQISYALREAQPHLCARTSELDRDPWLLNFNNCTLDLRTGKLRPHKRDDFITKLVRYNYNPDAQCPKFRCFLERVMGGGPDPSEGAQERANRLIDYLQKAFGYALTGVTSEKVVFIFHGLGNNGKTTLLSTFLKILEEYAVLLQIDTLMVRQESNNTQADLADLRGARFVMTSETEEGQRLAEGKLKRITQGMGKIKAVRKYENPIEFAESHKLFMDANHKPVVRGTDNAIWNRLHAVPFSVTIPAEEMDSELPAKLLAEADGILAWAIVGTIRWQSEGLGKPPEVADASATWRAESDPLREFIEDYCVVREDVSVKTAALWQAYEKWAGENGERHVLSRTKFADRLKALGCKQVSRKFGQPYSERGWTGIALFAQAVDVENDPTSGDTET